MTPADDRYEVIINGAAHSVDLETLRQWAREGRVAPNTVVTQGMKPPFPARHIPELREHFQQTGPVMPPPFRPPVYDTPSSPSSSQTRSRAESPHTGPVSMYQGDFPNERHRKDPRYKAAMKYIRRASWTGMIVSIPVFLLGLLALTVPSSQLPENEFGVHPGILLVGVSALFFLLNRGLHHANRLCAVLLFLWYVGGLAINFVTAPNIVGLVVGGAMTLLYLCALIGAFEYHAFRKDVESGNF
jgi:hypothetical protein